MNNTEQILYTIIIIFIIIIFFYFININIEPFDNKKTEMCQKKAKICELDTVQENHYQSGTGDAKFNGTINFKTPFSSTPIILTQIIGDKSIINNSYSIQVYDVTSNGFSYSKNKIENYLLNNDNVDNANIIKMSNSTTELFYWVAIS